MPERLENIGDSNTFSPEPITGRGINPKKEVPNPNSGSGNTSSILDRILNSPTSRHITYTSGPNSR